jgi:hypothetical protein
MTTILAGQFDLSKCTLLSLAFIVEITFTDCPSSAFAEGSTIVMSDEAALQHRQVNTITYAYYS